MLIVSLWKGGLRVGSRPEDSGSPHGITVRRGSTGTAQSLLPDVELARFVLVHLVLLVRLSRSVCRSLFYFPVVFRVVLLEIPFPA